MTARKKNQAPATKTTPVGQKANPRKGAGKKAETKEQAQVRADFPIVGIGASAGGLAAFEAFFSGMPADSPPGMAFVLVQHLAPDHKSILTELIKRYTSMQVFEVEDGMVVQPNCAYIIPPNRDMAFLNGSLQLLEPSAPRGRRMPIDFFFRSLAQDQHERAICIVLSGTGSDGTQGLRDIKGEGGMAMAQSPNSTEFDGMPRSAIATGLVDYELLPSEMPEQLIAYASRAYGKVAQAGPRPDTKNDNRLKKIFVLLRTQTGHDFSQYKPSTINRRIERRLAIHQIESLDKYVQFLQQKPAEVDALFRDLLIGVTSFFRDPDAFRQLEQHVIPTLFANKPAGSLIRVWSAGCATGEEAFSLAILLQEQLGKQHRSHTVQIFATDIDSQAIATARTGLFPASIATDISAERLTAFFTAEGGGSAYRINKNIRDMLVFSEQDVIKDPPFSRIDLLSCRNLLIYMGADLQKKLIPLFHYALNPGGFLFLGTSETVGEFGDLFSPLDRKLKLYRRQEDIHGMQRVAFGRFLPASTEVDAVQPKNLGTGATLGKMSLRELTEQALLRQVSPAGALVNGHGDILYLHGRTGMYLEPAPGEAGVNNILKMAREGLRGELTTALNRAVGSREQVRRTGLLVKTNGDFTPTNLTICPLAARPEPSQRGNEVMDSAVILSTSLYLIMLEEGASFDPEQARLAAARDAEEGAVADPDSSSESRANARIAALRQELWAKEEYLQTANEELKSTNEEMQSINEELQSTNEELETSKEELQSINEELATINTELQNKVNDLSRANNDMNNLLAGTGIATVFVDHSLRILRFTPAVTGIINLITSDIGRPVSHIVYNLVGYDRLVRDVQSVLDTLVTREVEVGTTDGRWYILRIQPYRTLDNVIEGAVITFVDITETKRIKDALHQANEQLRLAMVARDAHDAITVQDLDGRIIAWNPAAERMYGWSETEALAMNVRDLIPEKLREETLAQIHQLSQAEMLKPYRTQRINKNGTVMEVLITSTALINETGQVYAIATTERANGAQIRRPQEGVQ
ncbi:chemotaxis protein CheB [Desulfofustis limnaeus]|nr:chemotaxis protein CheB [Desulfofustis limnaeus]